jgi:phosphoribosyl-AMP cyclohydrolase
MEENQVLLTTKGYRVMDSMEQTYKYGVTVYQVWSREKSSVWHSGKVNTVESADCLEYETSSKAKANAVCEYLTLKAEQAEYGQDGLMWPRSIKV